ncbi:MAG: capsular biosynthesis protein [Acidobacteria bacterium]|nr:MAG: capsular biosynthesis protein [Acidobacteriota bacterium]
MKKTIICVVLVLIAAAWTPAAQQQQLPDCPDLVRAMQALMSQDARLRDWALLARYRDANKGVKPRVVFMGDSITDAWIQPQYGGFFPGKPYADRGISGQTTPQMLLRFRPDVIALHPDVVVILAGTNDIAANTGPMTDEEIEGYLMSMSELAQASNIRVVLSSITPVSNYHGRPAVAPMTARRPPARILAINSWMKAYAAEHRHVYLDYYPAMIDQDGMLRTEFSEDDLHPNAKGYAVMAPLAEAAIQRALK